MILILRICLKRDSRTSIPVRIFIPKVYYFKLNIVVFQRVTVRKEEVKLFSPLAFALLAPVKEALHQVDRVEHDQIVGRQREQRSNFRLKHITASVINRDRLSKHIP